MPAIQAIQNNWHEIENIGIEPQSLFQFAHSVGKFTDRNGIKAIDKNYKGKIFCYVNRFVLDGKQFTGITVGTNKHGGETFTFNNIKESKGTDYSNVIVKPVAPRPITQKQIDDAKYKENTLKQAATAFESSTSANIAAHPYLIAKKASIDGTGLDLRCVNGKLQYAIHNIDGTTLGYQTIDQDGDKKYVGSIGGGMTIIGGTIADCERGFIACEGLSTCLTAWRDKNLNPNNLPVVVCLDAGNMVKVVDAFVGKFDNANRIQLLADNDTGNDKVGNTGVLAALKICKKHGIKSYFLPFDASDLRRKVDFNDVQTFEVVDVSDKNTDYLKSLIGASADDAIIKDKGLLEKLGYAIANKCPKLTIDDAVNEILSAVTGRELGISIDELKAGAEKLVKFCIKKRVERIRRDNRITEYGNATRINVDGLSNAEIHALLIELEKQYPNIAIIDTRRKAAGKTQLMKLRADKMRGMAYGTHRVALVANACDIMNITSYKDDDRYADKIGFCINSVKKFASAINFKDLFLDETRQCYETIAVGDNVQNRKEFHDSYNSILRNCKTLHCADADFNNATLAHLQKHANHLDFFVLETTETKVNDVKYNYFDGNINNVKEGVLADLERGKSVMVGCMSVKRAEELSDYLQLRMIDESRILVIHSDNKGGDKNSLKQAAFLADMNAETEKYDCIIYTNVLGSGVSLINPKFEVSWMYYSNVLPANENLQLMARNRCAKVVNVVFGNQGGTDRVTNLKTLIDGHIAKGNEALADLGGGYAMDDLAMMSVETTATQNQSKNDFVNDFLFLASIEGIEFNRVFCGVAKDLNIIKLSAKATKEQRISDIFSATAIESDEYKSLKKLSATTQLQSNSIKRFEAVKMTGAKEHELTIGDVKNFDNRGVSKLNNYLLLDANTATLRNTDADNFVNTQNKTRSLVSRQKIFKAFLKPLLDANGRIGKKDFQKACMVLKKYHLELAGEFGNYNKETFKNAGMTAHYFLEKIGYEMTETTTNNAGESFYKILVNDDIAKYAERRMNNGL